MVTIFITTSLPFDRQYLEMDLTISPEKAQEYAEIISSYMATYVGELRRLVLVEDMIDSIKFGIFLWVSLFYHQSVGLSASQFVSQSPVSQAALLFSRQSVSPVVSLSASQPIS